MFGTKKLPIQGNAVSINDGNKTPQEKFDRAKSRVLNLNGKIGRLMLRKQTREIKQIIEDTKFAAEQWEKRMKLAEYELELGAE